ncbi:hypothetical protein BpHYR1_023709 [Brachionus plicatilis]|uniref:Uncharacterized protein n=1 Tax=Brachionus plicatilis TaxID=10195 RepID=A0A3M7RTK8_BRAPC|nr:hypothetical protein BpHYR1_023709 [Brachionus plicatilis]
MKFKRQTMLAIERVVRYTLVEKFLMRGWSSTSTLNNCINSILKDKLFELDKRPIKDFLPKLKSQNLFADLEANFFCESHD